MKEYKRGNKTYVYDADLLEFQYNTFKKMSNEEFVENIIDALHYACYVSWLNKLNTDQTLADNGIIHELVHLTKKSTRQYQNVSETRKKFNKMLKVSKKNYNFS
jgi:hypothetical protein|tara:strand:+ start:280 stop:591 length:312 start_codon:yes stop_codon:yes gene_type:complete